MPRILETFLAGKTSSQACEDFLFHDACFVAVVDGATDKTGIRIGGLTGGQIVAQTVIGCMSDRIVLPSEAQFSECIAIVTDAVESRLRQAGWPQEAPRPAACAVVYSASRREVWRVGDCHFRIDGRSHMGGKSTDDILALKRAQVLTKGLEQGLEVEDLRVNDIGRAAIFEELAKQHLLANAETEDGYPVLNGAPVPPRLREKQVRVLPGSHVVLCSDGFDFPRDTLAETVLRQRRSYETDPLRLGLDGCRPGTKALSPDAERHDDQCYVSFVTV